MENDPRSHGLWERTAPAAPSCRPLDDDRIADVVIIGAGYTGLSAALHLAKAGRPVAVLEAKEIGFGGSGRNVGLVNAGLWTAPDDVAKSVGEARGEKLVTMLSEAPRLVFDLIARHSIECEAVRAGTLHCGVGRSGAKSLEIRASQWQRRGADVELLGADETAIATGSEGYVCSLLDRRAGTIQPLAYVRGLARAAIAAGADILIESPATGVDEVDGKWRIRTPRGSVTAPWVVVATNVYSVPPFDDIRTELAHLPYFQIATAPLSGNLARSILPDRHGMWDTRQILTSVRMDRDDRLVIGSVGALRGTGLAVHRRWARRAMQRLFPQIGDVAFEAEWYGQIGTTSDGMARLHRLGDRMISTSGYNGRGIAPGTAFGRMMARYILGEITDDDLPLDFTPVTPQRWRTPREAVYEVGSQIAHLRR
ncbi:SARCOSINE OXIDASE BETA SUBUNIT [Fulvimarina pelagi HTCC2506]|uniref:SARCOSINE OXIDASE BETA SUBUNIT n=1 Tax=Fulvimarina pelagi HTCC2506 TaxID=314231 RepID=Q0G299_9HYPH|nr:FAD-binding oxidoreductase [Fulvimarina pelagi]EAU41299.1 SARCOSINE OXIDASE BETA SUBUNIT [Fulvimarina pelagi HTCC2506]